MAARGARGPGLDGILRTGLSELRARHAEWRRLDLYLRSDWHMDDEIRYAIVDVTVVGHQHYGVVVRSDSGRPGFVDRADLADEPVPPHEWPAVGDRVRGVVLGTTRTGRLRLTTRPGDVTLVGSVTDPAAAFAEWTRAADPGARQAFYRSPHARPLLRWALRRPAGSPDRQRAEELLSEAPPTFADPGRSV